MRNNTKIIISGLLICSLLATTGIGCGELISGIAVSGSNYPFGTDRVATIRIVMPEEDWTYCQKNALSEEYVKADFWFGDELVDMFGGETLCSLLENKTLFTFLERELKGEKLIEKLGGWLKKAIPFRGLRVIAYHKNWAYFADTFGLEVAGYIEPKPGIPPSAKHVQNMIRLIKDQNIKVMLVASYFERNSPQMIENRTGIKAIYLPVHVTGLPEIHDSFQLIDYWIDYILTNLPE